MDKLIKELENYLEEQIVLHMVLSELVHKETKIIVKREINSLDDLVREKEKILTQIEGLETKGYNLISLTGDSPVTDLRNFCSKLPSPEKERLNSLRLELKKILSSIKSSNKINKILIKNYLNFTSFYLKKLQSSSSITTTTYSPKGTLSSSNNTLSVLFHQKA